MARRRDRAEKSNMFGGIDPTEDMLNLETSDMEEAVEVAGDDTAFAAPTASNAADEIFGSTIGHDDPFAVIGRSQIKAKPQPIASIVPDRTQPRRAIPTSIRQPYWSGRPDAQSMAHLFDMWLQEVRLERGGKPLDIDAHLFSQDTERASQVEANDGQEEVLERIGDGGKPLETALLRVVDLAASIRRDGLLNPITVVPRGDQFEIETGERRWLAYQLLFWRLGDEAPHTSDDGVDRTWSKIPARVVDQLSIWRQASENNARADLNGIGLARQFALLLMDLRRMEEGDDFLPFDTFEHEQDFYAQVEDGNRYRVPRGQSERLMNAMGISHAGQLRHLRRLLRVPQATWIVADDLDWSASFIQKTILENADEAEAVRRTIRAAAQQNYSVSTLTVSEDLLASPATPAPPKPSASDQASPAKAIKNNMNWLLRNAEQVTALSDEDRHKANARIAEIRSWLDQLEAQLDG